MEVMLPNYMLVHTTIRFDGKQNIKLCSYFKTDYKKLKKMHGTACSTDFHWIHQEIQMVLEMHCL